MSKFNSDWIERNTVYRKLPSEPGTVPHYQQEERRVIVCLCGSTRFGNAFTEANTQETHRGKIVLSVGCLKHDDNCGAADGATKEDLDLLHKDKIDLSDEVLVLNVGGYVGDSTRSEVLHAYKRGKTVRWLEPDNVPADLASIGGILQLGRR